MPLGPRGSRRAPLPTTLSALGKGRRGGCRWTLPGGGSRVCVEVGGGPRGGTLGSPSLGGGCLRGRVFTGVERWVCAPVHAELGDSGAGGATHSVVLPSWRMRRRGSGSRRGHAIHLAYWGRLPRGGKRLRGLRCDSQGARPRPSQGSPLGEKDQLQGAGRTPRRALRVGKGGG